MRVDWIDAGCNSIFQSLKSDGVQVMFRFQLGNHVVHEDFIPSIVCDVLDHGWIGLVGFLYFDYRIHDIKNSLVYFGICYLFAEFIFLDGP